MNFGPTLINPTTTRYRFWAPALQSVALEVEGLEPVSGVRELSMHVR